jgi:hypothetical protein
MPGSRIAAAFTKSGVASLIERASAGDSSSAHDVWSLLILEHWLRAWDACL